MKYYQRKQHGFSAIIIVVLIVLFGLLGTYMATLTSVGSFSATQSTSTSLAGFAARSGAEWAVHNALAASDGGCTCGANCCAAINAQTINFAEAGLDGFQASLSCSEIQYSETPATYCIYNINATATNGSGAQLTSVSRTLSVSIVDRNAP